MSILSLLLPLINFVGDMSPKANWPPLTKVHQGLHDIVAEAGWLTNGMRVSKAVFWIQFPNPGDLWDVQQEHVTDTIWKKSKAAATRGDIKVAAAWQSDMEAEWSQVSKRQRVNPEWQAEYEKGNPPPRQPRRTAKVQIAMWPWIKQYSPVRQRSDGDLNSGEVITEVIKAQVVYYAGNDSDDGDARERLTLAEHLRASPKSRAARDLIIGALFTGMLAFLAYTMLLPVLSREQYGPRLERWLAMPYGIVDVPPRTFREEPPTDLEYQWLSLRDVPPTVDPAYEWLTLYEPPQLPKKSASEWTTTDRPPPARVSIVDVTVEVPVASSEDAPSSEEATISLEPPSYPEPPSYSEPPSSPEPPSSSDTPIPGPPSPTDVPSSPEAPSTSDTTSSSDASSSGDNNASRIVEYVTVEVTVDRPTASSSSVPVSTTTVS